MKRMLAAFRNSIASWTHLIRNEQAFKEETIALAIGAPLAFFVTAEGWLRLMLVGSIVLVMIVEVLNTAVEAACNALSREFHADIKIAKDAGSLAVLLSIMLAGSVWLMALWSLISA